LEAAAGNAKAVVGTVGDVDVVPSLTPVRVIPVTFSLLPPVVFAFATL